MPVVQFDIPNITGFPNLGGLITNLVSIGYFIAGLFFLFNLVVGGIQWITSGGDPKSLESARGRITNAAIGLIIVVAAFAITLIVERVFGIRIVGGYNFRS